MKLWTILTYIIRTPGKDPRPIVVLPSGITTAACPSSKGFNVIVDMFTY